MARYSRGDDETVITEYLDAHLEEGIKQKNLDLVLDLIDGYADLKEAVVKGDETMEDKEKLIEKRKMLNEQLNKADASGNMFLCINIGNALNTIDEKLRKMGVDVNHLD